MKLNSIIVTLFLTLTVFAQKDCKLSLSGYVLDSHNNEPLFGASVAIYKENKLVYTDSTGYYYVSGLCHGDYVVEISHHGCDTLKDTVHVHANYRHNFYPEHHAEELKGVLIRVDRSIEHAQSTVKITEKDLMLESGSSLGKSLEKVAGVTTFSTGSNIDKPVIRGMHSNRVVIVNNEIKQEGQQWGTEHAPEIDNYSYGSIDVIKGASTIKYGSEAIGGVIVLKPRALMTKPGLEGAVNLAGFSNGYQGVGSVRLDGGFKSFPGLGWRTLYTQKGAGNIHSPDYYLKNTGFQERNIAVALGYNSDDLGFQIDASRFNSRLGVFSGAHISNLTDLQNAFNAQEPLEQAGFTYAIDRPYQLIEHRVLKAKTYFCIRPNVLFNVIYAFQENHRQEFDKPHTDKDKEGPQFDFTLTTQNLKLSLSHSNGERLVGEFGIDANHQTNIWDGRFFIPNFQKQGIGAYALEKLRLGKHFLEAGVRYEFVTMDVYRKTSGELFHKQHIFSNVSGSLGGKFKFNDYISIKPNIGTAWRPPSINELYSNGLHHGAAAIEVGDTNLSQETAVSFNLPLNISYKKWQLLFEPYVNNVNNYIYLNPALPPQLTIQGAYPVFEFQQVNALFYGLDFMNTISFNKFFSSTQKATLIRAKELGSGAFLNGIPADRISASIKYNFNDGKFWKNTFVEIEGKYVFEQTRVPENGDFVAPPDGYELVCISVGSDVFIGKQKLELGFGVHNLLNKSYRDYMNRYRYFADDLGRNFILRIKIPFHTHHENNNH